MRSVLLQRVPELAEAFEREDHRAVLARLRDYVYRTVCGATTNCG